MKWSLFLAPRIPDERWRVSAGFCREQKLSFKQHVYWYWSFHKLLIVLVIYHVIPPWQFYIGSRWCGTIGSLSNQPHVELVPLCHVILIPFVFTPFVKRSAYRLLLFGPLLRFLPFHICLLCGSLSSVCLSAWVGSVFADMCVLCVCVTSAWVRVSLLSLYSPLMYSDTYIFPFQVLQVLLASQTLGTCSWACRVWMGILTKGHKSEPMYSHR